MTLAGYNNRNDRKNLFSQTDLVWENRLAGVDQTLLFGFELGREQSRNKRNTGTASPSGNIVPVSDPTVDSDVIFAPIASDANNRVKATVAAAYVQDQIRPADWLEIVAGLRFDSLKIDVDDMRAAGGGGSAAATICGRRASGSSPSRPATSRSTRATAAPTCRNRATSSAASPMSPKALEPERFDNYEVGAKWEILDGLLATAAVYQLDRTNTRATDPNDPSHTVLTGAQRSRGLELGLERSVTSRWLISAGYTLQKAEISRTTSAAPKGREVPLVPRHSFSLWNRYDVTKKIGVGLGVIARSKSYATISNAVKLPGYARVDAALFYQAAAAASQAQVNVENLLGAHYFPTANSDNNIAPGAPRAIKATRRLQLLAASFSARALISLRSRTNRARASRRPSWSGMRSSELGWTVTQHSLPSASSSGSPRTLADGHHLADQRSRGGRAERHRDRRADQLALMARATSGTPGSRPRRACCGCGACRAG